jgi:DNA mismatch repair protein MSH2
MLSEVEEADGLQSIALQISKKQNQRCIGAAVRKRVHRSGLEDEILFSIELYDFMDNEQYSNLDAFLVQMGASVLYLSEEYEDSSKGDGRKLFNLSEGKGMERVYTKKSLFTKKSDVGQNLLKLCGKQTHATNVAETERPLGYACLECLMHSLRLLEDEENFGKHELRLGSLTQFMRLDSAAAEAVNLLPKPDHPSQFGSIYGVLNRCKTKMGARLLERWLRQPLIDVEEINRRLDTVEVLKNCSISRNKMNDGPLKGVPDLDAVIMK